VNVCTDVFVHLCMYVRLYARMHAYSCILIWAWVYICAFDGPSGSMVAARTFAVLTITRKLPTSKPSGWDRRASP